MDQGWVGMTEVCLEWARTSRWTSRRTTRGPQGVLKGVLQGVLQFFLELSFQMDSGRLSKGLEWSGVVSVKEEYMTLQG